MTIAEKYIEGLKDAYYRIGGKEKWDALVESAVGLSKSEEDSILQIYPDTPQSLIDLLRQIDGTYYRKYGDKEYSLFFFGTDVDNGEYPYFLFSGEQIIERSKQDYSSNFSFFLDDPAFEQYVDKQIQIEGARWLCFSDCMNNGGTSSIFVDFTPSEFGKKGQIIRYLHDPDELRVVANSFDEYLEKLMDGNYSFINEYAL